MVIIDTSSITRWILTSCDDVTYLARNISLQLQRILQGINTRVPALTARQLKEIIFNIQLWLHCSDYDKYVVYTSMIIIILKFKIFPLNALKTTQNIHRKKKQFH